MVSWRHHLSVLQYHAGVLPSADPEQPYFARSGFIHPVFDPQKRMLTDAMPPDHLHQHGIMFAWGKATFKGRPVDFWNSKKQEGEIGHVALENVVSGPVVAALRRAAICGWLRGVQATISIPLVATAADSVRSPTERWAGKRQ